MRRVMITVGLVAGVLCAGVAGFQLKTPTDWKWRTDAPATVTDTGGGLTANQWFYVGMPPGWHLSTNPGVLLFHPGHEGQGNFSLRSEIFLFPGENQEEYGLFIGGRALEQTSTSPTYTAFVLRRDGKAAILKRIGTVTTMLVDWTANPAIVPQAGTEAMKNVLSVEVGAVDVMFSVNDKEVARVLRSAVATDGAVGFRVGKSLNMHITSFDLTHRLAPPVKK
ncbi:MAG: hypothetical protein ABIP90_02445 [Vicinamibacterales bacterium]